MKKNIKCGGKEQSEIRIKIKDLLLEEAEEFSYLGNKITKDGIRNREINCRILSVKIMFNRQMTVFTTNNIIPETRKEFFNSYIRNSSLYGCEALSIATDKERRLSKCGAIKELEDGQIKVSTKRLKENHERKRNYTHHSKRKNFINMPMILISLNISRFNISSLQ